MSESPTPDDYARCFESNPAGVAVLEHLERRFAGKHVLEGGIDGIRKSDFNAGMRAVIEYVALKISQAHGYRAPDPNEEP